MLTQLLYLRNKTLKENYKTALLLSNKEECDAFMEGLPEKDRQDIISYCDAYIIQKRINEGLPIREYFLVHLDDYKTEEDKKTEAAVNITMASMYVAAIVITAVFFM